MRSLLSDCPQGLVKFDENGTRVGLNAIYQLRKCRVYVGGRPWDLSPSPSEVRFIASKERGNNTVPVNYRYPQWQLAVYV